MSDDHTALYAAELAAFDGTDLEAPVAFDHLASIAAQIVDGPWWPGPPVTVAATRRDAGSSSARCLHVADGLPSSSPGVSRRAGPVIEVRLARPQWTTATLVHELAHALAGPEHGHDPVFRAAHLDVIAVATNLDPTDRRHDLHVVQLRTAFSAHDLTVADRRWPAPPAGAAGAIAL